MNGPFGLSSNGNIKDVQLSLIILLIELLFTSLAHLSLLHYHLLSKSPITSFSHRPSLPVIIGTYSISLLASIPSDSIPIDHLDLSQLASLIDLR